MAEGKEPGFINKHAAERVASRMQRDGFDDCTAEDVMEVAHHGTLHDDREALASRILQELEEYGF